MANFCVNCGARMDGNAAFCPFCGTPAGRSGTQPTQKAAQAPSEPSCAYCGAALKPTSRFCLKCGKPVAASPQPFQNTGGPTLQARSSAPNPQALSCPLCGAEFKATSRFCRKCGKTLPQAAVDPSSAQDRRNVSPNGQPAGIPYAAQNTTGQAAEPVRQATVNPGGIGGLVDALPNPGEAALNLPELGALINANSATGTGGLPGFVIPLIAGVAAGGVSAPLLYQLPSLWPLIVGLLASVLIAVVSFAVKKRKGGSQA